MSHYGTLSTMYWLSREYVKKLFNRRKWDVLNEDDIKKFCEWRDLSIPWVYKISNKENWKVYIWQSCNIYHRFKWHISLLRKWKHVNPLLARDFKAYWEKAFDVSVLSIVHDDKKRLEIKEDVLIWYDSSLLYNRSNSFKIASRAICLVYSCIADHKEEIEAFLEKLIDDDKKNLQT